MGHSIKPPPNSVDISEFLKTSTSFQQLVERIFKRGRVELGLRKGDLFDRLAITQKKFYRFVNGKTKNPDEDFFLSMRYLCFNHRELSVFKMFQIAYLNDISVHEMFPDTDWSSDAALPDWISNEPHYLCIEYSSESSARPETLEERIADQIAYDENFFWERVSEFWDQLAKQASFKDDSRFARSLTVRLLNPLEEIDWVDFTFADSIGHVIQREPDFGSKASSGEYSQRIKNMRHVHAFSVIDFLSNHFGLQVRVGDHESDGRLEFFLAMERSYLAHFSNNYDDQGRYIVPPRGDDLRFHQPMPKADMFFALGSTMKELSLIPTEDILFSEVPESVKNAAIEGALNYGKIEAQGRQAALRLLSTSENASTEPQE